MKIILAILLLVPVVASAQTWDEQVPDTTVVLAATAQRITIDLTAEQVAMCHRAGVDPEGWITGRVSRLKEWAYEHDPVSIDLRGVEALGIPLITVANALREKHGIQKKTEYRKTVPKSSLP